VAAAKDHIPEVDAEAVVEEAAREALNRSVRGPRRRTSSTWASIWTSRSLSSSMVVARVRLSELRAFQPKVLTINSVKGTLKGYDALMNLVLDDVHEVVRGMPLHHIYSSYIPLSVLPQLTSYSQTTKATSLPDPLVLLSCEAPSSSLSALSMAAKKLPTLLCKLRMTEIASKQADQKRTLQRW
jgi:hypothetical protein